MSVSASAMVSALEDALYNNPGVKLMQLPDGTRVEWDQVELRKQLAVWQARANAEANSGPPMQIFSLRPGAAN